MKKVFVGGAPVDDAAGVMIDFFSKIGKTISWDEFKLFLKRENPFQDNWLDIIVAKEKKLLENFFGQELASQFNFSKFSETLEKYGQEKIAEWKTFGLEPHFLPPVEMSQDKTFPGWKIKPENWFYEKVSEGKVLGEPLLLGGKNGQVVLVDVRCKPDYDNGNQMWQNDEGLLGGIIADLRAKGEIADYNPKSSRFGVSAQEVEQKIAPAYAAKLEIEPSQVRLEKAIEFNALSQILIDTPRAKDGQTNTWVWFADVFESPGVCLNGGGSVFGGLARVCYNYADAHWRYGSFRFLAAL